MTVNVEALITRLEDLRVYLDPPMLFNAAEQARAYQREVLDEAITTLRAQQEEVKHFERLWREGSSE